MTDEQNEHEGVDYCAYLVAFFDILGQRDKMSRIALPPLQEDADTIDKFKQDISQLYRNVKTFRSFFSHALEMFVQSGIESTEIPDQAKSFFKKLREHPISYRTCADSVIVHIRLKGDEMQYAGRAIYGVLCAAAVTFHSCMDKGIPIRGGVDLGFAMNIGPDEIYGPALASAYYLESKVASYPRIVVGKALSSYLKELAVGTPITDEDRGNSLLAKKCLALMTTDSDDNMIVDHLSDYIRNILEKIPATATVISDAYNFAAAEYETHKLKLAEAEKVGNIKALDRQKLLTERYELLKTYYDKHLPSWGIK